MIRKAECKDTIDKISKMFLDNCLAYSEARKNHDFVAGNPFARKLSKAAAALRHQHGEIGWKILFEYMQHEDITVRSLAAAECLDIYPDKAADVLETVACSGGLDAHSAEWALKLWRTGEKQFSGGPIPKQ